MFLWIALLTCALTVVAGCQSGKSAPSSFSGTYRAPAPATAGGGCH